MTVRGGPPDASAAARATRRGGHAAPRGDAARQRARARGGTRAAGGDPARARGGSSRAPFGAAELRDADGAARSGGARARVAPATLSGCVGGGGPSAPTAPNTAFRLRLSEPAAAWWRWSRTARARATDSPPDPPPPAPHSTPFPVRGMWSPPARSRRHRVARPALRGATWGGNPAATRWPAMTNGRRRPDRAPRARPARRALCRHVGDAATRAVALGAPGAEGARGSPESPDHANQQKKSRKSHA